MSAVKYPDPEQWEPGLPLFLPGPHTGYFFNFRHDPTSETCSCPDRAAWPEPVCGRDISDDPLAPFIREYRAWKEEQEGHD